MAESKKKLGKTTSKNPATRSPRVSTEAAIRKVYDELETRVRERTRELRKVNRALQSEVVEHKQAVESLRESELWRRSIFNSADEAILLYTADRILIDINSTAEAMFGYSKDEVLELSTEVFHVDHDHYLEFGRRITEAFSKGKSANFEFKAKRKNGEIFPTQHSVSLLRNDAGEAFGIVSIINDITERKKAEDLLQQAHDELELRVRERTRELESANRFLEAEIARRKKTEKALRESQQDLNHAQAVAQTGSWRLDVRNNQLLWSDETHRIFGIRKRKHMTYETFLASVHPEDREYVDTKWNEALQGEEYDIEHRIIVKGKEKWVREKAVLESDGQGMLQGGFGTVQDITERKKTEEELKYSRDYLNRILNGMYDAVMVVDRNYKVRDVNDRFIKLYGAERDSIIMRNCYEITHARKTPCSGPEHRCPLPEAIKTKSAVFYEHQHVSPDGQELVLEIAAFPIFDAKGEVEYIVEVQHDITEYKKVERMKDEFIGLVSHELRTPLTIVSGSIQAALSPGISDEDTHELLQNAADASNSLVVILENMLEMSRYQAGRLYLNVVPVVVGSIARNVAEKLTRQGIKQSISLDFPDGLPPVQADPVRVERILYNLIENAGKYSPAESLIKVTGRMDDGFIVTSVTDRGHGIAPEEKSKLFKVFERLSNPLHTKGIGLGLVVCKRLVEAQGGWIKVESKSGKGSTFSFALPVRHD
jgi:PAS domain S-box-containing protein